MATFTRTMAKEAFQHVITVVMDLPADHPLVLSITQDGIKEIMDLLSLSPNIIDALTYIDDQGATVDVPKYAKGILHAFNIFVLYKASIGETITNADWKLLTKKEFDDFRVSPLYISARSGSAIPFPTTSATGAQQPKAKDPVLEFKCGIKRDIN